MRKNLSLSVLASLLALSACDKESPELIPCMCNPDADSTLGLFDCMCEPAKKRPVRKISYLEDKQKIRYESLIIDDDHYNAYVMLHQSRDSFAPIKLENVDFRLQKNSLCGGRGIIIRLWLTRPMSTIRIRTRFRRPNIYSRQRLLTTS